MYHLANFAKQKEDETVNVIALLADATSSDQKIYANLANNVAPLATKLALANKIIVAALRENARLKCSLHKKNNGNMRRPPGHSLLLVVQL